jgi:hypothetical protein
MNPKEYLKLSFSIRDDRYFMEPDKKIDLLVSKLEDIGFSNVKYIDEGEYLYFCWPEELTKEYKI